MTTSRVYDSGADYDAQYAGAYEPEIRYLMRLALEQHGPVLDLCCGTGIVTVPLAETGLDVVGVDISEAMLETAQAKTKGDNPTFALADALEFKATQRFGLVLMTGNAFQCFLTDRDVAALLANVCRWLRPGGKFVFDMRLPEGYDFTLNDELELWNEYQDAAGNPVQWLGRQATYNAESGVLHYEMQDVFADGTVKPSTETLKFTPLPRLLELLQGAGLEVVNRYQNWRLEPFQEEGAAVVLETRKPA